VPFFMPAMDKLSLKGRCLAVFGLCAMLWLQGFSAAQDTPVPDTPLASSSQEYSTSTEQPRYVLKGTVVNAVTGEVIRGAKIELESSGSQGWSPPTSATIHEGTSQMEVRLGTNPETAQLSDIHGQFEFAGLLGGPAKLTARKPGFFSEVEIAPFKPRPRILVGPDAPPVVVKLIPESVISGKIVNEHDEPVEGVGVRLMREFLQNGRRAWAAMPGTMTNEDGEFRFAELRAGSYYVEVTPWWRNSLLVKQEHLRGFNRAFFPGAHDFQAAEAILLNAGQKFRADMQLSREPFYRVSGAVSGQVPGELDQQLECVDAAGEVLQFPVTVNSKEGKFDVQVPAGSWVIRLRQAGDADGVGLSGQVPVKVAGDLKDVRLTLAPDLKLVPVITRVETGGGGGAADGKNNAEGGGLPPQLAARLIVLSPEQKTPWMEDLLAETVQLSTGEVNAFAGLQPGRYTLRSRVGDPGEPSVLADANSGWYVKSAQSGSVDLLRDTLAVSEDATPQAIEIVFSSDGAALSGVVTDGGRPSPGAVLLMSESIPFYNRVVMANEDGRFIAIGLAPGNYSVLALEDGDKLAWAEPEVWANYAGQATAVTIEANQPAELKLERVPSGSQVSNAR
jgi:hypothetical protein